MRRSSFCLPLLAVLLLGAVPAFAGPILLDQSYTPSLSDHGLLQQDRRYAQSFTVGITGFLAGVDLSIGRG